MPCTCPAYEWPWLVLSAATPTRNADIQLLRVCELTSKRLNPKVSREGALMGAAFDLGFSFLQRASGYLDVGREILGRGLLGSHVVLKHDGIPLDKSQLHATDEVQILAQGSKTYIYKLRGIPQSLRT